MKRARKQKLDDWRLADTAEPPTDLTGAAFDELVVGHWFHMERMDNRVWWMRIGEAHINVTLDKDGTIKQITLCDYGDQVKQ